MIVCSVVNIDGLFSPLVVDLWQQRVQGKKRYEAYIRHKVHSSSSSVIAEPERTEQGTVRSAARAEEIHSDVCITYDMIHLFAELNKVPPCTHCTLATAHARQEAYEAG